MARYIKVEDAIKVADYVCGEFRGLFGRTKERLEALQTADVVEVVRCEHCVHCDWFDDEKIVHWCDVWDDALEDDGFCHYGERRNDDAEIH